MGHDDFGKKRVLIVEDDPSVMKWHREMVQKYCEDVQILEAIDAGEALEHFRGNDPKSKPDAMILDIMMPYGTAESELGGEQDDLQIDTGIKILAWVRRKEAESGLPPLWVEVVTARAAIAVKKIEDLLKDESGRKTGEIFFKPADTDAMEHSLALALGLKSKVPEALRPEAHHHKEEN